jgi:hypothetical protein
MCERRYIGVRVDIQNHSAYILGGSKMYADETAMVTGHIYRYQVEPTAKISAALLSIIVVECLGLGCMFSYWGLSKLLG